MDSSQIPSHESEEFLDALDDSSVKPNGNDGKGTEQDNSPVVAPLDEVEEKAELSPSTDASPKGGEEIEASGVDGKDELEHVQHEDKESPIVTAAESVGTAESSKVDSKAVNEAEGATGKNGTDPSTAVSSSSDQNISTKSGQGVSEQHHGEQEQEQEPVPNSAITESPIDSVKGNELSSPEVDKDHKFGQHSQELENKLDELITEENLNEPEVADDAQLPLSPKSPITPHRGPPPELTENLEAEAPEDSSDNKPPQLPSRDHIATQNTVVPPPLPGRLLPSAVAPPPPPRASNSGQDGLRPFKNKSTSTPVHNPSIVAAELAPPPLPPQLTESQKSQHRPNTSFASGIGSWFSKSSSKGSNTDLSVKSVDYEENYDLLLSRLNENNEQDKSRDDLSREQLDISHNELKSSFNEKISEIESSFGPGDETMSSIGDNSELNKVDWPFWTRVFNDYTLVAKTEPARLSKEIAKGIPKQIRSIVWQLVSNSNPQQFEERFNELKEQETPFEKNIQMDLTRTSYIADHSISIDSLHTVIKVYSLIDTEVGYTQGMAFVAAPLLLDMTELEAFAVLHKLMYGYNLRSLYLPEMPGLLLSLYQFDRLVEDLLPQLHTHFLRQGVRSSMFATQWFLTFFAYRFPLEFVLRIFDIVITEGFESILKFAIALVSKNEKKLLSLKFDKLLEFLKENLFSAYLIETDEKRDENANEEVDYQQTLKSNLGDFFKFYQPRPITVDTYDVNQFIEDATDVKLLPITLRRYEEEFEQIHLQEKERQEEVDEQRSRNQQLKKEIRKVEASYAILNREHIQIANEVINDRIKVETLEDEIKDLKNQNQALRDRIVSIEKQEVEVPADFESDLKNAMARNLEVMTQNQELEDQVSSLLQELEQLKAEKEHERSKSMDQERSAESPSHPGTHISRGWTKKFFK